MIGMVTVHKGQAVGMTTGIIESALSWRQAGSDDIMADFRHIVALAKARAGERFEPPPRSPLLEAMERQHRAMVIARHRRREQRGTKRAAERRRAAQGKARRRARARRTA